MAGYVPTADEPVGGPSRITVYAWIVFALSFGLLICDYMARQVLNAVFPLLKAQWAINDGQLGMLSGIVAAMVGVLTVPLSLAADRWGRVRSLCVMAVVWSLATLLCASAAGFGQMLAGRALVGVGEAAYGSVGIAVVLAVFPIRWRATLSAAFLAGGQVGSVLGMMLGSAIAASHGWRAAFAAIGVIGLILGLLYPMVVREETRPANAPREPRPPLRVLVTGRAIWLVYIGGGLQMFTAGAVLAWLLSYLNRYYHMPVDRAGRLAAGLLLVGSAGMVVLGVVSDRLGRLHSERHVTLAALYALGSALTLSLALALPVGPAQLVALATAMAVLAATMGPVGAVIADMTPRALHGSAFAALALAYNLIGFAPGPTLVGKLSDSLGLLGALRFVPLASLASAMAFLALRQGNARSDSPAAPRPG